MKIYESIGIFDPTNKEFSFMVQATKIGEDTYEIIQYFDLCNDKNYAIVAILSTKDGNDKDLTKDPANFTFAENNIGYGKLDTNLKQKGDLDIADAVNKKNEITVYVHHAIGFDINNPEDKAYLESYKNGTATNPSIIEENGGAPPAKGGRGILI